MSQAMTSIGRVEPLAFFPFETGRVKQQQFEPPYRPAQPRRTRGKSAARRRYDRSVPPRERAIAAEFAAAAATAAAAGAGAGAGDDDDDDDDDDNGGRKESEPGGGWDLPIVHLLAAGCLHLKVLPSPVSFYSLLSAFSRSIGTVNIHMAPGPPEPALQTNVTTPDGYIPELPPGTKLSYLAEGGANVVYRIILPDGLAPEVSGRFNGKLLRLRKLITSSVPYTETIRNFDTYIRELFDRDELVNQEAVKLPRGFVASCNTQLRLDEALHQRPAHRHGVYLSTKEPFGLLVTDMTPESDSGACLWEFKPKWLLQSPSAPSDATRCRTCALRDMKNYDACMVGGRESRSFCPLDLASDNFEDVLHAMSFIKGAHSKTRVASFLHGNGTLSRLQKYQRRMNAVGLPGLGALSSERALSMTLRDCTMYVKVPENEAQPLQVRLGDLDFKSGIGGKWQYWRDVECRLIEEGWYSGSRDCQKHSTCALQRRQHDVDLFAPAMPR